MTKRIPLTQGKFATVDDENFDWLNQWKWHANKIDNIFYALRGDRRGAKILMHREIAKAPKGMVVDHIDGDGLNNVRENLRVCTNAENLRNRKAQYNNKSGYKGVSFWNGKYESSIWYGGKRHRIGRFYTVEEAARAYEQEAKRVFGEFARTNF